MVPVSAVLLHLESVFVHAVGRDAMKTQTRHAVHVGGQDDAVPVDGGVFIELVFHPQGDGVAFTPAQQGAGQGAIDGHGRARLAGDVHRSLADEQVEVAAAQSHRVCGPNRCAPQVQASQKGAGGQAFDEGASGWGHLGGPLIVCRDTSGRRLTVG
ncbi:hypothetical protein D3C76_1165970 [compost metagenome]